MDYRLRVHTMNVIGCSSVEGKCTVSKEVCQNNMGNLTVSIFGHQRGRCKTKSGDQGSNVPGNLASKMTGVKRSQANWTTKWPG